LSATQTGKSDYDQPPPPPKRSGSGVFWKLLGLSIAATGGVVGYAWYDPEFRKTIEQNVPYSSDALKFAFDYLPPSPQLPSAKPIAAESRPSSAAALPKDKQTSPVAAISGPPAAVTQVTQVTPAQDPVAVTTPRAETNKERAAREAREKKEKAQEALRRREAEEAAENLALETGLESLLTNVRKTMQTVISSQRAATQAVKAHTEQLKKAMDAGSTENHWEALTDSQQTRTDAVWASGQTRQSAQDALEKLRRAIADGRTNKTTKRNKVLSSAEKELSNFDYELSSAVAELEKARSEATVLTNYRDLVRKGKRQFSQELEDSVPEVKLGEGSSGRLTKSELNSLIAHAHRRVDQLQRQLVEQLAMEPLRAEAALESQRQEDERLADKQIELEQQKAAAELKSLREAWEIEAHIEFEAELRHYLTRQAAAHSDHLVDVLRAQRIQLEAEFEKQLVDGVKAEKERLAAELSSTIARMEAIEAAVEGRAQKQRSGRNARELWLACKSLLSIINDLGSVDEPTVIAAQLDAVRNAGSEYPIVHVALATIPSTAGSRGIYSPDVLSQRFDKVRNVARRVAMVDETNGTLVRYFLSYVQSFFVLHSTPSRDSDDVASLSTFALLDNAAHCIHRGDLEQAVRFVNQLRGESRRVAADWLVEARLLLETKQAVELLLAFASANGLDSLD
jgi:mitofilin